MHGLNTIKHMNGSSDTPPRRDFLLAISEGYSLLTPLSHRAVFWCHDNLPQGTRHDGMAFIIEPSRLDGVVDALRAAGMRVN